MMNTNKESNKTRALVAAIILCISLLFTTGCSSADVTNDVKSALGMEVAAVSHTVYVVDQTDRKSTRLNSSHSTSSRMPSSA